MTSRPRPCPAEVDTTTRRVLKSKVRYVRRAAYSTADQYRRGRACRFGTPSTTNSDRISNSLESHESRCAASWSSLRWATRAASSASCHVGVLSRRWCMRCTPLGTWITHNRRLTAASTPAHSSNAAREPPRRLWVRDSHLRNGSRTNYHITHRQQGGPAGTKASTAGDHIDGTSASIALPSFRRCAHARERQAAQPQSSIALHLHQTNTPRGGHWPGLASRRIQLWLDRITARIHSKKPWTFNKSTQVL
jgi:hypothetical protein